MKLRDIKKINLEPLKKVSCSLRVERSINRLIAIVSLVSKKSLAFLVFFGFP